MSRSANRRRSGKQVSVHEPRHVLQPQHLPNEMSQLSDNLFLPKNVLSSGRNAINPQRVNTTEGPISCSMHSSGSPETCPNNGKLCFPKPFICVSIYTRERAENKFLTHEFDKHPHETAIYKLSSFFFGFPRNIKIAGRADRMQSSSPLCMAIWHHTVMRAEALWLLVQIPLIEPLIPALKD